MAPSLHAPTDRSTPRPPGPIARALIAIVALALAILAFLIAVPLLIALLVVGAIALAITRWRLRRRVEAEFTQGRRNVRVIRRDAP